MKKLKNKKLLLALVVFLIISILGIVLLVSNNSKSNNLTLSEKKWIDSNKKNMVDISIINDLPIFSSEKDDIFLSFLGYLEAETGLTFNKVTYNSSKESSDYLFNVVSEKDDVGRNDLLFYKDNYVILSKENKKIQKLSSLTGHKIAVLSNNLSSISDYLSENNNLTFVNYDNSEELFKSFNDDEVEYVIIPKNSYLKDIVTNNYYISYNLSNLYNKYVLTLSNNNSKLNSIFTKMYNKWYSTNFNKLYETKMNEFYYNTKGIDEKTKSSFLGKKYIFGYVFNAPYEISNTNGLNLEFIKGFEKFSKVEFQFKKYNSVSSLTKAYENGEVDIMFNYYNVDSSSSNETINVYNSGYVILSHLDNNSTIDSLTALSGKEIYTLKDTKLATYINNNTKAVVKTYSKINSLLKSKNQLILLDTNTYNYYKNTKLKDYYIVYEGLLDLNYNFLVKRDSNNNVFTDIFQYYLFNINSDEFKNRGMSNISQNNIFSNIPTIYYMFLLIILFVVIVFLNRLKDKKQKNNEDKAKYIDPLTSLKNRNYLNANKDKWDYNKVYPQAIILVDLNDLKSINNDYGYTEGDKVIKNAANILINNQLKNSDIMRTDGNEFTIYLVGYNEEQIVLYMRKIYKLMKDLPYEKGATLGYSMILDDIKLVDDAINEAILDIRGSKESKKK